MTTRDEYRANVERILTLVMRYGTACAEQWTAGECAGQQEVEQAKAEQVTLLAQLREVLDEIAPDGVRRRRVWFPGDAEPPVGTKVLAGEVVWLRHAQLRWIAAPGGNGAPGISWETLIDHSHVVEVFENEPHEKYGNLILPAQRKH